MISFILITGIIFNFYNVKQMISWLQMLQCDREAVIYIHSMKLQVNISITFYKNKNMWWGLSVWKDIRSLMCIFRHEFFPEKSDHLVSISHMNGILVSAFAEGGSGSLEQLFYKSRNGLGAKQLIKICLKKCSV